MTKKKPCPACLALKNGIRSRVAYKHTCGEEPAAVKLVEGVPVPLTFSEIKESVLDDPRIPLSVKGKIINETDEGKFIEKLVDELKIDE